MSTFIAYANIQQFFPFDEIPSVLVPENLLILSNENTRVKQRHQCRRLAHFLLWKLLKVSEKSTALLGQIQRTKSERPYFFNEKIDFNISHSDDWVAVVLNIQEDKQSAVGIDIEFPKKRNFLALMEYFAPEDEIHWFTQQISAENAFYRCWCLREAVLKSQGVGIVKLSEVRHFPCKQKIFSDYCPQGELLFTNELPFYFAMFVNQRQNQPHFFQWNGEKLVQKTLKHLIHYDVN
ncbi:MULTISPECIES: 4'-phosphopantetheinyl transferase family protein [Rodentibacter]|uniref:4'-phosphopantetheinyl transferase family protein n=1 Tax=Rodentibacter TaxID=1960084 RepID=UPI001CFDDE6E|nr:4'-phosphopantetheinyl transferase superfamily protein [Rodentibacter sp. JRC1]GJI56500.1 putative 4'-phosphopantetheinyl transferase [Rodentibacter sp. JRC1]